MTKREGLEKQLEELKAKCNAQRERIEKCFNNTYEDLLDLSSHRDSYLINNISLLGFNKDTITFTVEFEDSETAYLNIKPGEIKLRF